MDYLKKYDVTSIMTISEHTMSPSLIIKFNNGEESRIQLIASELYDNINNSDFFEKIISEEYMKNKLNQRKSKIKKIINKI